MSVCRGCGARITWARSADGKRWLRPLEARYTLVLPDPDEVSVTLINGEWHQIDVNQIRMYKPHACPEDSRDLIGMGRVREVDEVEDERIQQLRQEELEAEYEREEEEYRLQRMERVISKYKDHQLKVDCPACYATPGEPCKVLGTDERSYYVNTPCKARNLVTAFDETQPWPPRRNQRGYRALEMWLYENPTVLLEPALLIVSKDRQGDRQGQTGTPVQT